MFCTNHETRNTNHGFSGRSVRRGCASVAPPKSAARTAAPAGSVNGPWPSMAVHDTEYPTKMHKIPDPAEKSLLAGSLLSPMARRCSVGGGEPVSAHGQCFSTRLTASAVRWKSHKNAQNPGSHRKIAACRLASVPDGSASLGGWGVSRCPRPVSASRPASRRAPFAGNPTKMHKIPDPAEKCEKRALRRSSRSPAGRSRCVECRMNPCCESKGNVR